LTIFISFVRKLPPWILWTRWRLLVAFLFNSLSLARCFRLQLDKIRKSTLLSLVHGHHGICVASMIHQVSPIRVHHNRLAPSNNKQKVFGTRERNIHASHVTQESNTVTSSGSYTGKDDNVCLSSLKGVNSIHFHQSFILWAQRLAKESSQQLCVLGIGRNDGYASLSR
jgi:hypothetical protein